MPSLAARGKAIVDSGVHSPACGVHLGHIEQWGLDVYENSPQQWKDALYAEAAILRAQEAACR